MQSSLRNAVIAIAATASAMTLIFFLAFYLPAKDKRIALTENIENCRKNGQQFYENFRKFEAKRYIPPYLLEQNIDFDLGLPELHYNTRLNTCLASLRLGYTVQNPFKTVDHRFIYDINSGEKILESATEGDLKDGHKTAGLEVYEFEPQKEKLMNE